jgi:uncharacterized protein YecE (DUF72 family)
LNRYRSGSIYRVGSDVSNSRDQVDVVDIASAPQSVRAGVCGFCLPQAELFRRFNLLEVQQTFYWPPRLKTVERWRQTAPEDFEFTVKAFQAITHPGTSPTYRRTKFSSDQRAQCGGFCDTRVVRDAWSLTFTLATALEATIVVFQCPPRFDASDANMKQLRRFFQWAERGRLRFAWEPRHATWTSELVRGLCRELDLIHVVDPLEQADVYGQPRYLRLHGKALGGFRYDYSRDYTDDELAEIYRRCLPGPTYCLFNNKQMATDTQRFMQLLEIGGADSATPVKPR